MQGLFGIIATPFGYVMRYMYEFIGNYGVCIILFSLLVKIVTSPLTLKQKRSMKATQRLQPKIQAIQKKYYNDKNRMNEELTALYDREGVSPMSGCGTMLITMLIILGLYYVISQPLTYFMQLNADQVKQIAEALGVEFTKNSSQITLAGKIFGNFDAVKDISSKIMPVDFRFLCFDLASTPSIKEFGLMWILPIVSGFTALGQTVLMNKLQEKQNGPSAAAAAGSSKAMLYMMPLMSVVFGFTLPAGLSLYWISNNVFGSLSELVFFKIMEKEANESVKK